MFVDILQETKGKEMAEDEGMHMSRVEISFILKSFRPIKEFGVETGIFVYS